MNITPKQFYNGVVDTNVKAKGLTEAHNTAQQSCITRQALAYMNGNVALGNEYLKQVLENQSKLDKNKVNK